MNIHSVADTQNLNTAYQATPTSTQVPASKANPVNDMESSMEEISMKFSESVERNNKTLEERSVKPRRPLRAEKLEALYQLLAGPGEQLHDEIRRILALGQQQLSLDYIMKRAEGDPAKADILLQHAMHQARAQGNQDKLKTLQSLSHSLNEEYGREVQAGINTAEAMALFSQDPQQRQSIRSLYYKNIVGQASLAAIFDTLLSQFDERHFTQGVHTLMRAMTDDLSSQFPSVPTPQLKVLLRDLTASQQLSNILNNSRGLLERFSARGMMQDMTPPRLTRRLIDFTQGSLYPREVKALSDDTVGSSPLQHVKFLNALYPLVKKMPLPLWKDGESRRGALNLILRMMTEYAHYEKQQALNIQAQQ